MNGDTNNSNGQPQHTDGSELGELLGDQIDQLSPCGDDPKNSVVMGRLCSLVTTKCHDDQTLRGCVDVFHRKCLENREFTRKFARFCSKIQGFKVGEASFRSSVLDKIELDFKARGLNRDKCYAKYVNAMVLLCEILVEMRLANGSPIPVLVDAGMSYLFNFIDEFATEDSIVECCRQVQRLGPMVDRTKFEKFVLAVKEKLIDSPRLSSVSRACLTFIIDFAGRGFAPLKQADFYTAFYAARGVPLAALNFVPLNMDAVVKPPRRQVHEVYQPPHVKHNLSEPSVVLPSNMKTENARHFLTSTS